MTIDASDIAAVIKTVTKEWTRQRKAEERHNRSRSSREYIYSDRVNFTDVANAILPAAYDHASGGKYSVSKRQLYYACREQFRSKTGRELEYEYFASTLLVQFLNRHPQETADWKITADPRGTLVIPNAGHHIRIPCGTIDIDNHLEDAKNEIDPFDIKLLPSKWPSVAAGQRYQAVLYIEKEGFGPLLEEARIAERFDVAILSCKGQSVVAARKYVDQVCWQGSGIPLLVVHDFDKSGFEIAQRLTQVSPWAEERDRVTYEFKNIIDVHDLGLRLNDVRQYELAEERCKFTGQFASDSTCTAEEKEFLRSGRRVELNAFTSPQFIEWLESKLEHHLPRRLIPGAKILEAAYQRAWMIARLNDSIASQLADAENADTTPVPPDLEGRLQELMKETPGRTWDAALYRLAESKLNGEHDT